MSSQVDQSNKVPKVISLGHSLMVGKEKQAQMEPGCTSMKTRCYKMAWYLKLIKRFSVAKLSTKIEKMKF
jgi:hypothetical protein